MEYQPKTGQRCTCKRGVHRDNCPACEGTGWRIDFKAIRERAPKGWSTAGGPTDQEPVKTEQERVSCAIVQAWDAISDVPFPLYHREAMALAAAAIDAMKVKA